MIVVEKARWLGRHHDVEIKSLGIKHGLLLNIGNPVLCKLFTSNHTMLRVRSIGIVIIIVLINAFMYILGGLNPTLAEGWTEEASSEW